MQIGALVMPVEKSSNIFQIPLNHKLSFMPRMSLVSYAHFRVGSRPPSLPGNLHSIIVFSKLLERFFQIQENKMVREVR